MKAPPLVVRARAAAAAAGASTSWSDDAGSFAHVLAAGRAVSRAAEIGAVSPVATAWIAAALRPGVPLFTVAADPEVAIATATLFADDPDTAVLAGPWREALGAEAPFDFIVVHDAEAKRAIDDVLAVAAPRATILLDVDRLAGDEALTLRESWLNHARLDAALVGTRETEALVGVVRG